MPPDYQAGDLDYKPGTISPHAYILNQTVSGCVLKRGLIEGEMV